MWRNLCCKGICKLRIRKLSGASLGVQWLAIHLPMQGIQVWLPVREDPTCPQGNQACVPQLPKPLSPGACTPWEKPLQWEAQAPKLRSIPPALCNERKPTHSNKDRAQPKIIVKTEKKESYLAPTATVKTLHYFLLFYIFLFFLTLSPFFPFFFHCFLLK